MSKSYDRCPPQVHDRMKAIMAFHHRELAAAEVTVDLLFVSTTSETAPALSHHGVRAYATIQITSPKDRALGHADAQMIIDMNSFNGMSDRRKDALLDHELEHLAVVKDEDGAWKTDDQHRPCLKIVKHDVQFGWFASVALRHGPDSIERQQAHDIAARYGQEFFPFALTLDAVR